MNEKAIEADETLVERLRRLSRSWQKTSFDEATGARSKHPSYLSVALAEAADEIERLSALPPLRAREEIAREALAQCVEWRDKKWSPKTISLLGLESPSDAHVDEARKFTEETWARARAVLALSRTDEQPLRVREEIADLIAWLQDQARIFRERGERASGHHYLEVQAAGNRDLEWSAKIERAAATLSRTAGQEWRVPECVEKALRHAKADIDAAIPYIGRLEGTPYGLLQTQSLLDEAIAALPAPPVTEPIVAEKSEVK